MTVDYDPAEARRAQLRTAILTLSQFGLGRATSGDCGADTTEVVVRNRQQLGQFYSSVESESISGYSRWRTSLPPPQYTERSTQSNPRIPVQPLPARRRRVGRACRTHNGFHRSVPDTDTNTTNGPNNLVPEGTGDNTTTNLQIAYVWLTRIACGCYRYNINHSNGYNLFLQTSTSRRGRRKINVDSTKILQKSI